MEKITELQIGKKAPAFCMPNQNGKKTCLKNFAKQWVVLYFYPKDDTLGCTIQGIEFTKEKKQFEKLNAVILGVSSDRGESHCRFIEKHALGITLLSDINHPVAQKYGVWREKNMYGHQYFGIHRSTFLIAPGGKIAHCWYGVTPAGHATQVLNQLKLSGADSK